MSSKLYVLVNPRDAWKIPEKYPLLLERYEVVETEAQPHGSIAISTHKP